MKKLILAGLLILLITNAKAEAVTITNGSFESGLDGWYVTYGNIDHLNGYWQASDGSSSIDLAGNQDGGIAQIFNTVVGQKYIVTFDLAGNPDGGPALKTLNVQAASNMQTYNFLVTSDLGHSNMGWSEQTFIFTAEKEQTELSFGSQVGSYYGPALDNVRITEDTPAPTPEPSSLILGLASATGLFGLRRRKA
jgi:choice-of-anchor C domain-containing protein